MGNSKRSQASTDQFYVEPLHKLDVWSIVLVLILVVLLMACLVPVSAVRINGGSASEIVELKQLEMSLHLYGDEFGEAPPHLNRESIENHIKMNRGDEFDFEVWQDELPHELSDLDDYEALVFWLNGEAWRLVDRRQEGPQFFAFCDTNLVDRDNDGWKEYESPKGNLYVYWHGGVYFEDSSTKEWISCEEYLRRNKDD